MCCNIIVILIHLCAFSFNNCFSVILTPKFPAIKTESKINGKSFGAKGPNFGGEVVVAVLPVSIHECG